MARKFEAGDRVRAVNMAGVNAYLNGKLATIIKNRYGDYRQVFDCEPLEERGFFESRFELYLPLSPLEEKVRAYIQRELPNGSA